MTKDRAVAKVIVDLVPQWISSTRGPENLLLGRYSYPFLALREMTPQLTQYKQILEKLAPQWIKWLTARQPPSAHLLLQEAFALEWLKLLAPDVNWHKALQHTMTLSLNTFENAAITSNLVVSPGVGTVDITDSSLQKLMATLGGSMRSFLRVDGQLRLLGYESIPWNDIRDTSEYKLYPEFLHPFHSILEDDEVSLHHTSRGDLLVLMRGGLRAARRKGLWRIYDPMSLKESITEALADYWVGANVFEFLLDLSFKRHGALLVYDPDHAVIDHLESRYAVMEPETRGSDRLRSALKAAVDDVRMGHEDGLTSKKRLMLELASMDGAIVFDRDSVLAIGAMIPSHEDAGKHPGARTTAAHSALAFGGHPIKVSTDGDIDVYFSGKKFGEDRMMVLSFL